MFTTGITACDALIDISFRGNILDDRWFQIFVKQDLKCPKPYPLAIVLLGDIVSWYRPQRVFDEAAHVVAGYKKCFTQICYSTIMRR